MSTPAAPRLRPKKLHTIPYNKIIRNCMELSGILTVQATCVPSCTLYNSLILPYLQYCSIIWASTYSSHLQPLFRLQKKALRIITHSPPRAHTYSLFNKFKILNIFNIYKYQVSCFVFLHMQELLLSPLSSLFVLNSDCYQYLTRQKDNLHLHTHKLRDYFQS